MVFQLVCVLLRQYSVSVCCMCVCVCVCVCVHAMLLIFQRHKLHLLSGSQSGGLYRQTAISDPWEGEKS
jgi:hypothetical protein